MATHQYKIQDENGYQMGKAQGYRSFNLAEQSARVASTVEESLEISVIDTWDEDTTVARFFDGEALQISREPDK